jgi:hypothetical protein
MLLATWALVIVAIAAIVYQVRETSRSRSAEALTAFREIWDSQPTRPRRRRLAAALLDGNTVESLPQTVVEDVINFFEDLAMAVRLGHLDKEAMWNSFYEDATYYWSAVAQPYARELRNDEQTSQEYREFEDMIAELVKIERKKSGTSATPDMGDIRVFLEAEAGLDRIDISYSGLLSGPVAHRARQERKRAARG